MLLHGDMISKLLFITSLCYFESNNLRGINSKFKKVLIWYFYLLTNQKSLLPSLYTGESDFLYLLVIHSRAGLPFETINNANDKNSLFQRYTIGGLEDYDWGSRKGLVNTNFPSEFFDLVGIREKDFSIAFL